MGTRISSAMAWDVRTTGSDTVCGGGFRGGSVLSRPSAPTVTATSGGSVAVGTYYVAVTFVEAWGETQVSNETSVITTSGTQTIKVTSPVAPQAFADWNIYVGTTSGGPYYQVTSPLGPYTFTGTQTITTTPPSTHSDGINANNIPGVNSNEPPGTDYSQQNSAQVTIDNSTVTATGTTNTITFQNSSYTPTKNDVGNMVLLTAGTNVRPGFYEIMGFSGSNWIMSGDIAQQNPTSAGTSTITAGYMGGALASPGWAVKARNYYTSSTLQDTISRALGSFIWLKSGTYTVTSSTTNVSAGCVNEFAQMDNGWNPTWVGYDATHGDFDGTMPTIQNTQNTTTLFELNPNNFGGVVWNITFDANNQNSVIPLLLRDFGDVLYAIGCKVKNCPNGNWSLFVGYQSKAIGCEVTGGGGGGYSGIYLSNHAHAHYCVVHDMAANAYGIYMGGYSTVVNNCLVFNETVPASGTGRGIHCNSNNHSVINCSVYGWRDAGIAATGNTSIALAFFDNNISYGNGTNANTYDIDIGNYGAPNFGNFYGTINPAYNYRTYMGGINQGGSSSGTTQLTANPWTNAAGGDFSLNNTSGGGALVKATRAYPSPYSFVTNGTNFLTAGALPPQTTSPIINRRRKVI